MENKKLLKFLYKDIAEIEELFMEKGSEGFDEYEIEFIQSRFKGAKQIIQIFSEKENKRLKKIRPRPVEEEEQSGQSQSQIVVEEKESLQSQSPFVVEKEKAAERIHSEMEITEKVLEKENVNVVAEDIKPDAVADIEEPKVDAEEKPETQVQGAIKPETIKVAHEEVVVEENTEEVKLNEEEEEDEANNRLGDSFSKEKSVNELLARDSNKLEHKISNSPVASIKATIGINDRYQYIRELFEGNADTFSKAVNELDNLNSIKEAVTYLQQNYKWKKNDTSLKFVNLIKRRFPNE